MTRTDILVSFVVLAAMAGVLMLVLRWLLPILLSPRKGSAEVDVPTSKHRGPSNSVSGMAEGWFHGTFSEWAAGAVAIVALFSLLSPISLLGSRPRDVTAAAGPVAGGRLDGTLASVDVLRRLEAQLIEFQTSNERLQADVAQLRQDTLNRIHNQDQVIAEVKKSEWLAGWGGMTGQFGAVTGQYAMGNAALSNKFGSWPMPAAALLCSGGSDPASPCSPTGRFHYLTGMDGTLVGGQSGSINFGVQNVAPP